MLGQGECQYHNQREPRGDWTSRGPREHCKGKQDNKTGFAIQKQRSRRAFDNIDSVGALVRIRAIETGRQAESFEKNAWIRVACAAQEAGSQQTARGTKSEQEKDWRWGGGDHVG